MGQAIDFLGSNKTLGVAEEMQHNVSPLRVYSNGTSCISCWQLSEAELQEIIDSGGKLFISVMFGPTQPPVYVGSESMVREVNADLGLWKK